MSIQVLERVKGFLESGGFTQGYEMRYFRWSDEDIEGRKPFMMFRISTTASESDKHVQVFGVEILVATMPDTAIHLSANELVKNIQKRFRQPVDYEGIKKLQPISEPSGPMYLENGRPVYMLNVRCFVNDH